jgi:hypothetical protein
VRDGHGHDRMHLLRVGMRRQFHSQFALAQVHSDVCLVQGELCRRSTPTTS